MPNLGKQEAFLVIYNAFTTKTYAEENNLDVWKAVQGTVLAELQKYDNTKGGISIGIAREVNSETSLYDAVFGFLPEIMFDRDGSMMNKLKTEYQIYKNNRTQGGKMKRNVNKGGKIHTGKRGGKYIIKGGQRKYLSTQK